MYTAYTVYTVTERGLLAKIQRVLRNTQRERERERETVLLTLLLQALCELRRTLLHSDDSPREFHG